MGNETQQRKIIHIDMDCFYAAVEMRDNPQYRDMPLAIGGETDRRAVLSTCNYLARSFGCHSAMPSYKAKQLCPDLLIIPGRMHVYEAVSKQIREIFYRYTALVETLSLDEAFLDVSQCKLFQGSATYLAQDIRRAIYEELQLSASAGISHCKFLAKIASDVNKPNGQFLIAPCEVQDFIKTLELKRIPGVGKVAQQKLFKKGLVTCADIKKYNEKEFIFEFGKLGSALLNYSQGNDPRPVLSNKTRKSVAVEHTYDFDLLDKSMCLDKLEKLFFELQGRLKTVLTTKIITKIGVKIKFADFTVKSAERKSPEIALPLFNAMMMYILDRNIEKPVRLLGLFVGVEYKMEEDLQAVQLNLLDM
ncbi:MAG: DNA polymerase IV [Psychromonas sp.]|nr:DNA polymerase IV [Psychromonas sp.]